MAELTPREYELAVQLYNIWRGDKRKGGKAWPDLSFAKRQRWFRVAHAVLKVQNG